MIIYSCSQKWNIFFNFRLILSILVIIQKFIDQTPLLSNIILNHIKIPFQNNLKIITLFWQSNSIFYSCFEYIKINFDIYEQLNNPKSILYFHYKSIIIKYHYESFYRHDFIYPYILIAFNITFYSIVCLHFY